MNISILSLTKQEYAQEAVRILGKGAEHAGRLYSEWCRTGKVEGEHAAFDNAQKLLKELIVNTDFSVPVVEKVIHAGETRKFVINLKDGLAVESVIIPMKFGWSLCVSSQVGCRMGCRFCQTGRMGLKRHLRSEEIVAQLFVARHILGYEIRNIVFMGMGEPMDNFDAVMRAVRVMTDQSGFALGKRHITISTVGRIDGIRRLMEEGDPGINLAVSINAPNDDVRKKIMPLTRKYNMAALKDVLIEYCSRLRRSILIEYVLMGGMTDSLEAADELAEYLRGLPVKVNLIPYNAQEPDPYDPPRAESVEAFAERMRLHGYSTLLRKTKGDKIMAACGQLGE